MLFTALLSQNISNIRSFYWATGFNLSKSSNLANRNDSNTMYFIYITHYISVQNPLKFPFIKIICINTCFIIVFRAFSLFYYFYMHTLVFSSIASYYSRVLFPFFHLFNIYVALARTSMYRKPEPTYSMLRTERNYKTCFMYANLYIEAGVRSPIDWWFYNLLLRLPPLLLPRLLSFPFVWQSLLLGAKVFVSC